MVFRDFEQSREDVTQEVNIFLNKTWGIEHYTDLAPAVLLLREPGHKAFTVFPLLLEESDDERWTASVLGESTDEIQITGGNGRGDLKLWISDARLARLEPDSTRRNFEEGKEQFVSTTEISLDDRQEEGFEKFLIACLHPGKGVVFQTFGTFIEPYSVTKFNFYAADTRELLRPFTPDEQFKLAKWLKERVEEGRAVPFSREEEVAQDQEGEAGQPLGQQEGGSEIPF